MERLIVWHRWCPPPESSPEAVAQASLWRIQARERLTALGGEMVAELGGTVVAALPREQLTAALETCLALSLEAEQEENLEVGSVAHALTLGPVERTNLHSPLVGDCLDRAQALASYAARGDVVLDQEAQATISSSYLFSGELRAGTSLSGALVDRGFPHRARCADSIARLAQPSLSATAQVQFDSFRRLADGTGRQRVVLVAPFGAGATAWLTRLDAELKPSAWLNVRGLGAGFAPLSGLRYALSRLVGINSIEHVLAGPDEPDRHALATLRAISDGGVAVRRDAIMALRQYVGRCWERGGKRALISVNPVALIDPATISVVSEVAREGGPDCLVVMRLLPEGKPPEAFTRGGGLAEIRLPAMPQAEARSYALSMLGKGTTVDIARRAAVMGGSLALGVAEAVRALVSSGDIVPDEIGFRWRRGPAGRVTASNVEGLIEERIYALDDDTRRILQVLAWVPDPSERGLVSDVALLDGLAEQALDRALKELVAKALVERADNTGIDLWLSHTVRSVVLAGLSPARVADLSLRVAGALSRRCTEHSLFARADVAFYLARGGRPQSAVDTLLEAAMAAGQHGFVRSGVRLAAAAVECNPATETRKKAAAIAESLGRVGRAPVISAVDQAALPHERDAAATHGNATQAIGSEAIKQAVSAIRARDFDRLERALELMIAAGRDGPHVDRIRALAQLEKGDHVGAALLLARSSAREAPLETPRTVLARALLRFQEADPKGAIRDALHALAQVRAAGHGTGERAALLTLSAFYAELGRAQEATLLKQAAGPGRLPKSSVGGSSAQ